ncbi:hypothetical protein [Desulfonatronum thioautotrophicum]|uniref:hypothetical protein n=1 Tax=Desulfonatronum thioautotrophicum TaxID=617001 RepID=UPI0005EBD82B|nr:hypothetical protein [Desulfonatronum thioautotrophicum]
MRVEELLKRPEGKTLEFKQDISRGQGLRGPEVMPIRIIADKIRDLTPPADISLIMEQVEELLDRSVATEGYFATC